MKSFTARLIASSRVRLAVTYLAIIMVLSFGFSGFLYVQSVQEAKGNLSRQSTRLRDYLYFTSPEQIQSIQDNQLQAFKKSLIKRLLVLNLGMFVLGGCLSIILAKRSLRPMERALEAQSRFTSDAAHELRTPLTAMKTEIEVALRSKKLRLSEAKETLSSSLEEVVKLELLTSALLRLARDSRNIDRTYWQHYKLADILQTAYDRLAEKAKLRDIGIELPKTKLIIFGDPDQLVELFVTLLGNAIKYSPNKSKIQIKAHKDHNSMVVVKVIDNGIGISQIDLPHIFERFYRADHSRNKSKVDGYGLGLSLAESIVKTHNGKITVKSTVGEGSVFTVLLPNK